MKKLIKQRKDKDKERMIDRCYIEITNTCNLNCHFCPKHTREKRQLSAEEFNLLTDKIRGKVCFLYFHLMGEPLLIPCCHSLSQRHARKDSRRCLPLMEPSCTVPWNSSTPYPTRYNSPSIPTKAMPRESSPAIWMR